MKVFKKKLVQRFSCILCAILLAVFCVFSVMDFSARKQGNGVITASAFSQEQAESGVKYYIKFSEGCQLLKFGGSASSSGVSLLSLQVVFDISCIDSCNEMSSLVDNVWFNIVAYTDSYTYDFSFCTFVEDSQYLTFAQDYYCFFAGDEFSQFFDSGVNIKEIFAFRVFESDLLGGLSALPYCVYGCLNSSGVSIVKVEGGASQSDLQASYDRGYQAGYNTADQDVRQEAFQDGYGVGFEDGKKENGAVQEELQESYNNGYNEGKNEVEEKYKRGLFASFQGVKVSAYNDSGGFLYSIEADYGVNAVSFNTAFLEYEYMIEKGQLNPAYYMIYFFTEQGYEYEIPLEMLEIIAYGDVSIFGQKNSFNGQGSDYYAQTWRNYPMYFDTSQDGAGYPLVIEYNNSDPHLSRARLNNFGVKVQRLELLRNLQFVATSGYYSQGYMAGEKEGYTKGLADGETVGYNKGYEYGENVGYNRGVEGAGEYTFLGLFTAVVDAPIKAFLGLLDFEIFGMDMQKFFLSILTAALCVAVYRLFSGSAV